MGTVAQHVALANWAKSFFEVAGIETVPSGALEGNEDQASTFKAGGFNVAAVCASKRESAGGRRRPGGQAARSRSRIRLHDQFDPRAERSGRSRRAR